MIMPSEGGVGDETLHSRFEHIAGTNPAQIAVVAGNDVLTYGELNERSNRVAWRLRDLGVGRETLVGLSIDRSVDMVVGLLAVLKAGGAYVPLDPGYPRERLKLLLDDSDVPVVVTQEDVIPRLPRGNFAVLALDDGDSFASYP